MSKERMSNKVDMSNTAARGVVRCIPGVGLLVTRRVTEGGGTHTPQPTHKSNAALPLPFAVFFAHLGLGRH